MILIILLCYLVLNNSLSLTYKIEEKIFEKRFLQSDTDPLSVDVLKDFTGDIRSFNLTKLKTAATIKVAHTNQRVQGESLVKKSKHKSYLQLSSFEVSKYDLLNEFLALKIYQYAGIYIYIFIIFISK
jgi:hypothetical protein